MERIHTMDTGVGVPALSLLPRVSLDHRPSLARVGVLSQGISFFARRAVMSSIKGTFLYPPDPFLCFGSWVTSFLIQLLKLLLCEWLCIEPCVVRDRGCSRLWCVGGAGCDADRVDGTLRSMESLVDRDVCRPVRRSETMRGAGRRRTRRQLHYVMAGVVSLAATWTMALIWDSGGTCLVVNP